MKTEIAFILDRSGSMGSMTHAAIAGYNEFLQAQQWEFLFLGANQDAIATAAHMGIHAHNAATFAADAADVQAGSLAFSSKVSSKRRQTAQCNLGPAEIACAAESMTKSLEKSRKM